MQGSFLPAIILLAIAWFAIFWILGGVFFATVTILGLRRIRQVRFSCMYTILALAIAFLAAYAGIIYGRDSIGTCLEIAETKVQAVTAVFGCGFASVILTFIAGVILMVIGGYILMNFSRATSEPWIRLGLDGGDEDEVADTDQENNNHFFTKES